MGRCSAVVCTAADLLVCSTESLLMRNVKMVRHVQNHAKTADYLCTWKVPAVWDNDQTAKIRWHRNAYEVGRYMYGGRTLAIFDFCRVIRRLLSICHCRRCLITVWSVDGPKPENTTSILTSSVHSVGAMRVRQEPCWCSASCTGQSCRDVIAAKSCYSFEWSRKLDLDIHLIIRRADAQWRSAKCARGGSSARRLKCST